MRRCVLFSVLSALLLILANICFIGLCYANNCVLQGNDIFGHLFRTRVLYESWNNGVFFPYYTDLWYNTSELFRYWPPLPYYFAAFY